MLKVNLQGGGSNQRQLAEYAAVGSSDRIEFELETARLNRVEADLLAFVIHHINHH
jgi:hypothetical protein